MKLSEAIMLGSLNTLPGSGPGSINGYPTRCALGAALHAVNYEGHMPYTDAIKIWPWMGRHISACPACGDKHVVSGGELQINVMNTVWMLNDIHKWTRPQIAAWVASIEPAEAKVETEQCEASHSSKS
jgi:hypothetical protein